MAYIQSYKNQNYLLPPKITDLFSKNHVSYLIDHITERMDFSSFDEKYAGAGHPAYHPRILVKILAMAQIDGMRSSRRIAKNSQENVVYIHLAEKTSPDFRTISDFRKDNPELMKNVFKELNTFALEEGLIDLSHISTDGTSIKANASDFKSIKKEQLEKMEKWIDKYMEESIKIDEEEDKLYGNRGLHELPEGLLDPKKREPKVQKIADRINKAMKKKDTEELDDIKEELNEVKQVMEKNGLKQFSFIDPDSRFMLNKKGRKELSYNAQVTVDRNGIIVANDVVQDCEDRRQLIPAINQVEQDFGQLPEGTIVTADPGFENGPDLVTLEQRGFDLYVPGKGMTKKVENKFAKANFVYDEEKDVYICPENKVLTNRGTYVHSQNGRLIINYTARVRDCKVCPYKQECCGKAHMRNIGALPEDKFFQGMKKKLQTEEGKAIYKIRQQTVETAIGDIKENKKFRGFLLRGLPKVKIEFNLSCIARNLVMINNMLIKRKATAGC